MSFIDTFLLLHTVSESSRLLEDARRMDQRPVLTKSPEPRPVMTLRELQVFRRGNQE